MPDYTLSFVDERPSVELTTDENTLSYTDIGVQGPTGADGLPGQPGQDGETRFLLWDGTAYPARPDTFPVTFYGPTNPNTLGIMIVGDTWINTTGEANVTYALSSQVLPAGGTAGQVLSKVDATDYNATWVDAPTGGGTGGGGADTWGPWTNIVDDYWVTPGTGGSPGYNGLNRPAQYRVSTDGSVQMKGCLQALYNGTPIYSMDIPHGPVGQTLIVGGAIIMGWVSSGRYPAAIEIRNAGDTRTAVYASGYNGPYQNDVLVLDGVLYVP
jgi:hypothetical protein